ncbi:MAG TPA: glycosyltransferase family 2 protein [Chloroflexia bacterium]|nr:glycosyltransferase family 2 protein [Chloroflexia bacterium]
MNSCSPLLTTVIVNWNTRELLRNCLNSLINGTCVPQQIWVVDNASTDGSPDMVRAEFPEINLLVNSHNSGFAAANNQGIRAANPTEYVLLLNPDTEVPAKSIDKLVAYLELHPEIGAAGVQLLNPDGTLQASYDHYYSFVASFWRNLLVKKLFRLSPGTVTRSEAEALEVDWIIGACVMLRRAALSEVGLLDESFFMYGEEVDLQRRIREAGWKIIILPHVNIVHFGGQSSKQASLKMMIQEYRSRYLLVRKHNSTLTLGLYLLKAWLGLGFWSVYWGTRSLVKKDEVARQWFHSYLKVLQNHLRPEFYRWPRVSRYV